VPSERGINWSEINDANLAGMAADGDDKAFEQILQRYRQRILRICLRMLGDKIEAEEAAQDIFVKVYYHLKDFDRKRELGIWLSAIAINDCRDRLRKHQRGARMFRGMTEADLASSVPFVKNDCDEERERLMSVERALQQLPEKLKEVIVLKAYGEHSYEEIARVLKIRMGTVMSRLFRARQRLTEIMERGNTP